MDASLEVKIGADLSELQNTLRRASVLVDGFSDNSTEAGRAAGVSLASGTNTATKSVQALGVATEKANKSTKNISRSLAGVEKQTGSLSKGISSISKGFSNFAAGFGAGFVGTAGIALLGQQVLSVTANFEKLQVVLANTLNSKSLAEKAFSDIQKFASTTPFAVDEVTESFVKLANQGFTPTVQQLRDLGNLAASTGKSFGQLTEAVLDAQVGEFERLKEFGIRAKDQGDKVAFTFKGVTTEVEKTSGAIRDYIVSLGQIEGVAGATEKISETLSGKISNLGDSFTTLFNTLGSGQKGFLNDFISGINNAVSSLSDFIERLNLIGEFNLGKTGDFRDQVNAFFGFGKSADAAFNVEDLKRGLDAQFADALIALKGGAQKFSEFNNAIYDIIVKPKYLEAAKRGIQGEKDAIIKLYSEFGQSVVDAYNNGINSKKPEANFGKGVDAQKRALEASQQAILDQIAVLKEQQLELKEGSRAYNALEAQIIQLKGAYDALGKSAAQASFILAKANKEASDLGGIKPSEISPTLNEVDDLKIDTDLATYGTGLATFSEGVLKVIERNNELRASFQEISSFLEDTLGPAFDNVFMAIFNGEDVFDALTQSIKAMVAQLAAALIKMLLFKGLLAAFGGGALGSIGDLFGGGGAFKFRFGQGGLNAGLLGGLNAANLTGDVRFEIAGDKLIGVLNRTNALRGING